MNERVVRAVDIQLTPAALQRMRDYLSHDAHAMGIRLGVQKQGCSGYQYIVETTAMPTQVEQTYTIAGISFFIDDTTVALIEGSTVDFIKDGFNQKFIFQNPKVTGVCGCGESFTVDTSL